jgi:5-methylthioadenosine/S-adenosylhomocysteine deaminase
MFTPLLPGDPSHIYSHLVFAANASAVDTTIIDGRVVMRGRQLLTVDEELVRGKANEALREVVSKL